ncbi:MAG TPA: hypothetical protein VIM98_08715 [Dyella sp.]|uniref:hypothetical protein n=1 Tax=Dyella sp. TaxID=1869338 RepID=UPI002F959A24
MSADRISPSSSLAETLRALARDRIRDGHKIEGKPSETSHPRVEKQDGIEPLRQRLRELAHNIDVNNPDAVAGIRDSALREILLWEFGGDFRKDSQFQPMVEAIGKAMDNDKNYRQRFTALLAELQRA